MEIYKFVNWSFIQLFILLSVTHTHTHTHIYIYISVCVCVCTVGALWVRGNITLASKHAYLNNYRLIKTFFVEWVFFSKLYIYIYIYICVCVYPLHNICVYTHTHTHIHIYTHIYIRSSTERLFRCIITLQCG